MYVCIYIYIYMYARRTHTHTRTHAHTHTHTHTHAHTHGQRSQTSSIASMIFVFSLTQMFGFLSRYVIFNVVLSIFVCAAASLLFAWVLSWCCPFYQCVASFVSQFEPKLRACMRKWLVESCINHHFTLHESDPIQAVVYFLVPPK